MSSQTISIHAAPWVIPVSHPIIEDGGVAVSNNTIIGVGERHRLQQQYPAAQIIEHPDSALTPALVNAHIHLELSHLADLSASPFQGKFTDWIKQLLHFRDALGATSAFAQQSAYRTAVQQYDTGVGVLADIGNTLIGKELAASFSGMVLPFKEYLGLADFTLSKNLQRLQLEPDEVHCSGHAVYSTHPELLRQLKKRANLLGHIFPIHAAEPRAEREMIQSGTGELVDFVRQRGFCDGSFKPLNSPRYGTIHYLRQLNVLDEQTLCIHAIHVSEEEIRILAGEGGKICLCPGSNRFLDVGKAPVQDYLEHGILPALGTDSLASNPELSLWREMQILAEEQRAVDPAVIFAMATRGGAEALECDAQWGTLEKGKTANLLVVRIPSHLNKPEQIFAYLVTTGSGIRVERINEARSNQWPA